jgi:hypothetical protein
MHSYKIQYLNDISKRTRCGPLFEARRCNWKAVVTVECVPTAVKQQDIHIQFMLSVMPPSNAALVHLTNANCTS